MSFSAIVKNELCRMEINDDCCLLAELSAVLRLSGIIKIAENSGNNIKIVTENAAFARKYFSLVKRLYDTYPEVIIRKSKKLKKHTSYILTVTPLTGLRDMLNDTGILLNHNDDSETVDYSLNLKSLLKKTCCRKAYLRGAFLAGGSISDPEKTYHLEITSHSLTLAVELNKIMNSFKLKAKIVRRKGNYVTYLKEGENIVDFLNIVGAHRALMELENVRILKDMRNSVNRIVNCETANLEKTVNASVRQVDNINYIKDNIGFDKLPESLAEVASIRLLYNDVSLKELGEMLSPPLGKSGVNHRLRKLDRIAEKERELRGQQQ